MDSVHCQAKYHVPKVREMYSLKTEATRARNSDVDKQLRSKYRDTPNLELAGFKVGFEKDKILEKSWILVNTSVSEGLPVSFLEAAAHHCAILSPNDPDGFTRNFGYMYIMILLKASGFC